MSKFKDIPEAEIQSMLDKIDKEMEQREETMVKDINAIEKKYPHHIIRVIYKKYNLSNFFRELEFSRLASFVRHLKGDRQEFKKQNAKWEKLKDLL